MNTIIKIILVVLIALPLTVSANEVSKYHSDDHSWDFLTPGERAVRIAQQRLRCEDPNADGCPNVEHGESGITIINNNTDNSISTDITVDIEGDGISVQIGDQNDSDVHHGDTSTSQSVVNNTHSRTDNSVVNNDHSRTDNSVVNNTRINTGDICIGKSCNTIINRTFNEGDDDDDDDDDDNGGKRDKCHNLHGKGHHNNDGEGHEKFDCDEEGDD